MTQKEKPRGIHTPKMAVNPYSLAEKIELPISYFRKEFDILGKCKKGFTSSWIGYVILA